jgi:hypothetical protein
MVATNTFQNENSHFFSLKEVNQTNTSDSEVLKVVTNGKIKSSFLNTLPKAEFFFSKSSFAYIDNPELQNPFLHINSNYFLDLDEGAKNFYPDRRDVTIPLPNSSPNNYRISAIG